MWLIKKIIRWWLGGSNFPMVHVEKFLAYKPENIFVFLGSLIKNLVYHPLRRRLAKYYLLFLKKVFGLKIVAITGSAGKTSTKEMIYSILSLSGKTQKTYKNIDPIYNIPSTILSTSPYTKYLILEMSVEYPGEMDFYLWLAKPDIAVITNIYPTHLEFLKSVEGVSKEKSKLIKCLTPTDWAVLNSENSFTRSFKNYTRAKVVYYGDKGFIKAKKISYTKDMKTKFTLYVGKDKKVVRLPMLGRQYVSNALAAAGVCHLLGSSLEDIKRGLENLIPPEHRMTPVLLKSGTVVFDDSYNNNPEAAKIALNLFSALSKGKKKIVVMGEMRELGGFEEKYHREIGKTIGNLKLDLFIGIGLAMKYSVQEASKRISPEKIIWLKTWEGAYRYLKKYLKKDTYILIKGSRSLNLDCLVSKLS